MHSQHFTSVRDLLEVPSSAENEFYSKNHWERMAEERHFYGVSSKEEAHKVLLGGWPEGLRRIRETIGMVELPQITSIRRKGVWKDAGDDLSLDRLYSGEATPWRSTERRSCPPGLIPCHKIMVSVNGSYKRKPEEFFWRGAAAVVLADALEESGRACEIVAYSLTAGLRKGGRVLDMDHFADVVLKQADSPPDLSRVASMTAHPAALRVAFFRAKYACPWEIRGTHGKAATYVDPPVSPDEQVVVIRDVFSKEEAQIFLANIATKF